MKKLSETYKELGIDFSFPIEIEDDNGNVTYYEDSYGYWIKYHLMTEQNRKWSESPIHDQVKRAGLDNAGEAQALSHSDLFACPIVIEDTISELKQDKERLDWLLKNCSIKELDLGWVHDCRETIDEAMNYLP